MKTCNLCAEFSVLIANEILKLETNRQEHELETQQVSGRLPFVQLSTVQRLPQFYANKSAQTQSKNLMDSCN